MDIKQKNIFGMQRKIELKDKRCLVIHEGMGRTLKHYQVDLLAFANQSRLKLVMARHWLVACLLSLMLLGMVHGLVAPFMDIAAMLTIINLSGIALAVLFLVLFVFSLRVERVFVSRYAKVPLLSVFVAKPTWKRYRTFIAELEKRITKLTASVNLSDARQRAGELKTIRRLVDENILSRSDYEKAKPLLLR